MSGITPQPATIAGRYRSPWSVREKLAILCWATVWLLFCRWTPKYWVRWRNLILKAFGCRISGRPFVHPTAKIRAPWRLTLEHKACLGPRAEVYNLGPVTLRSRATVAQYVYLCAGSHDFDRIDRPLITGPIILEEDCFIGAKALILMNVTIGRNALVGAGAVVPKDVPPNTVVVGNPARVVKNRMPPQGGVENSRGVS